MELVEDVSRPNIRGTATTYANLQLFVPLKRAKHSVVCSAPAILWDVEGGQASCASHSPVTHKDF